MLERLMRLAQHAQVSEPEQGPELGKQQESTAPAADAASGPITEDQVIEALRTVYDPELPVNIYDLGLIYAIRIDGDAVHLDMTLTAPACPVAGTLPGVAEDAVRRIPGVSTAVAELVWDPPWTPAKLSEAARLELGML